MSFSPESYPTELQSISAFSSETEAPYKAYFFGPFRLVFENQSLGESVWRRNKAKALLKWFLLNPGKLFSMEQLIKQFWPNTPPDSAMRNFHVTIHYLRHLLEPDLKPHQESKFVRRNKNNFYWFVLGGSWWSDVFDVQHHYGAAKDADRNGDAATAISHYRHVVSSCSRGFLPEDVYDDVFYLYRQQYDYIAIQALERLITLCSQMNMFDEVMTYSLQILSLDPYCEAAIKAIINVYLRQGNSAGAIRKLDDFQHFLRQELGITPSENILSLREKILKER